MYYHSLQDELRTRPNKYIEIIKNNFGELVGLHQTGGLDNRTLLAAFLNRDIKPQMLYGVGNSCLTNTRREDLDIVRMFEKDLGLKLKLMDWSNDKEMIKSQNWDDLFKKYGFLYSVYGGSESFFNSYEQSYDNYPKFMECGYFLENLRLREFARDNIDESITLNDFIEQYLLRGVDDSIVNHFDAYKNYLTEELKLQIDIYGIDLSKGITKENFDEVRWIHARHADTIMVNFLNLYTSSFSIFSQPELHQYPFNVPSRFRENGSFQLMVIKALYPKLLDFPFFSHLKPHYFDPIKVVLKPIVTTSKPQQYRLKTKAYIEKALGTNITNYLLMMYRKFRKTKNTQVPDSFEKIISHTTTSIISNSQLKKDLRVNTKTGDLRLPMRIALTLKAIDYSRVRKN